VPHQRGKFNAYKNPYAKKSIQQVTIKPSPTDIDDTIAHAPLDVTEMITTHIAEPIIKISCNYDHYLFLTSMYIG